MKHLSHLLKILNQQMELHRQDIYNYAVPAAWNVYGYRELRHLRSKEILVNPYHFYAYTLQHIFNDINDLPLKTPLANEDNSNWLTTASIYGLMIRTASAWDHDRDEQIDTDNLYHLRDQGTCLKSIALLPYLKRMGITTILMHQPFETGTTYYEHTYAKKEAVYDHHLIQKTLADPIISDMDANEQFAAFVEACHILNIRVILEYCPGKLARDNRYIYDHPEWFYWIDKTKEATYQPPLCYALPQNTIPHAYTLRDFYRSEQVHEHIAIFQKAPTLKKEKTLDDIEKQHQVTTAPYFSDQINAGVAADLDCTPLRFYEDMHDLVPENLVDKTPYITQDILRADLHPGTKPMKALWDMLCDNITWYQKTFQIDGIYLQKAFLIPEDLQVQMAETARKQQPNFVMIAEDAIVEHSDRWLKKGYDAISGNGAYEERFVWNYKFHDFAYHMKGTTCPMFVACEFYDSLRIHAMEHGNQLALTLSIMNYFLPNGIPYMEHGVECYETQPLQLSEYGDENSLLTLPDNDIRAKKQGFLDPYFFDYRHDQMQMFFNVMTNVSRLRQSYIHEIHQSNACIPVWFDSPKDLGIGFTYLKNDRALMVICSVNVHEHSSLHIHTENLFCELPFKHRTIRQIYSSIDPYIYDITLDDFQNIPLDFAPGEVKFIEFN